MRERRGDRKGARARRARISQGRQNSRRPPAGARTAILRRRSSTAFGGGAVCGIFGTSPTTAPFASRAMKSASLVVAVVMAVMAIALHAAHALVLASTLLLLMAATSPLKQQTL